MPSVNLTNASQLAKMIASEQAKTLAPAQAEKIIGKYFNDLRENHEAWQERFIEAENNRRDTEDLWREFYNKVYQEETAWWKTTLLFALNGIQLWALYQQYDQQKEIADRTYNLADRQQRIAEDMYNHYREWFRPHEVDIGKQIDNYFDKPYKLQYEITGGRFVLNARNKVKGKRREALMCVSQYCTGALRTTIRDLAKTEANAIGNAMNSAVKYENLRKLRLEDKWVKARLVFIQAGRGVASQGITGLDGAATAFHSFGADPGAALGQLLSTIAHTVGGIIDRPGSTNYAPVVDAQPVPRYAPLPRAEVSNNVVIQN